MKFNIYDLDFIGLGFKLSMICLFLGLGSIFFPVSLFVTMMLIITGIIGFTMFPVDKGKYLGITITD